MIADCDQQFQCSKIIPELDLDLQFSSSDVNNVFQLGRDWRPRIKHNDFKVVSIVTSMLVSSTQDASQASNCSIS